VQEIKIQSLEVQGKNI